MRLRWSRDSCFHFCGEINSKTGLIRITRKALSAHPPPQLLKAMQLYLIPPHKPDGHPASPTLCERNMSDTSADGWDPAAASK